MIELVSCDSGLGSDESASDCEDWPQRNAEIIDDDRREVLAAAAAKTPRKMRRRRTKRRRTQQRSLSTAQDSYHNLCDGKEKGKGDDDRKSISAYSLMISNARQAVERLSCLLADLRLSCGLPLPRAIISDAAASNDKPKTNGDVVAHSDWHTVHSPAKGEEEVFERRHDDNDADDWEKRTTGFDGREKKFSKTMKYFDAIGAQKATRTKNRRLTSAFRRYTACISALAILLTFGLSSTFMNARYSVSDKTSPHLRAIESPIREVKDRKNAVYPDALYEDVLPKSSTPSKLRWHGDSELLQFAIERETKRRRLTQDHFVFHVNSLLTESAISSTSNLSVAPFAPQAGPSSATSVGDPSLIDYEAIDVYWRRDIEQEKNPWYTNVQPLQSNPAPNALPAEIEQFERDLQLLTEKSMTVQLNSGEQRDYENLSKSYYTDFYLNVGGKAADKENNHDGLFDVRPTSSRRSGCAAPIGLRPLSYEYNAAPSTSKTIDSVGVPFRHWLPPSSATSVSHDRYSSGAEKTLVIQRRLFNADGAESSSVALNAERRGDGVVLNDVSLADANTFEPLTGDVAEFFDFSQKESDGSDIPQNDNNMTLVENRESVRDEDPLALPFEHLFDEGFIDTNFAADGFTLNELTLEVMREDPFQAPSLDFANELPTESEPQQPTQNVLQPPAMDEVDRMRYDSVGTPSSGINSATFASSPSHGSSHEEFSLQSAEFRMESRFYNKLAPFGPTHFGDMRQSHHIEVYVGDHDYYAHSSAAMEYGQGPSDVRETAGLRRGRRSKDEQLAVEYDLPASAEEITHMTHAQVQHILRNPQFTPAQKALVKKIRRRGRNKVAARKCRERRINPMLAGYETVARSVRQPPFDATAPSTSRQAAAMYAAPLPGPVCKDDEYFDDDNFEHNHDRQQLGDFRDGCDDEEVRFFANYRRDWSESYQFDNHKHYDDNNNRKFHL